MKYKESTRKHYSTKYTSLSGGFCSEKNNSLVWFESSLERDFALLMEFNPEVSHYLEQPFTIEYFNKQGKKREYTPDFLVHFLDDTPPWLCEIKPSEKVLKMKAVLSEKINAAKKFCKDEGYCFRLFTDENIRTIYLDNIKFLNNYDIGFASEPCIELIEERLMVLGSTTIKELLISLDDANKQIKAKCIYALWCLIKSAIIGCDLSQKISVESEIWLNDGQD